MPFSRIAFLPLLLAIILLAACHEDDPLHPTGGVEEVLNLPATPFNYAAALPAYITNGPAADQDNTPANNAISNAGATLGRVLFYDVELSANRTVACATCHRQEHGFSDPAPLSTGFDGGFTGRHSMGLTQARFYAPGSFFWDQRAGTLEEQVLMPIQDLVEMGMTLDEIVIRLEDLEYYPPLFTDAFGDETVTADRIARALAQFVRSLTSFQTKFDAGFQNFPPGTDLGTTDFPNFTASENQGKALFFSARTNCAACHGTPNFVAPAPRNNGLDATTTDEGVGGVTGNAAELGLFKVNSLRNVALTAPFMHDGRFATLDEVVEHYNSGVQAHPNLSPQLRQPGPNGQPPLPGAAPRRLNLTGEEKQALVDFLHTLTDEPMLTDEKFANPFKQ